MIQKILTNGRYEFRGTIEDLKKCLNSFKITKVIRMGTTCGINMCDVEGKFKYHGIIYKLYVSKIWTDDILILEYRGESHGLTN